MKQRIAAKNVAKVWAGNMIWSSGLPVTREILICGPGLRHLCVAVILVQEALMHSAICSPIHL